MTVGKKPATLLMAVRERFGLSRVDHLHIGILLSGKTMVLCRRVYQLELIIIIIIINNK